MKYIKADELMEIIKTHHYMLANALNSRDYGMFTTGIEQAISKTESVEVVRCEGCKHWVTTPWDLIAPYCEKIGIKYDNGYRDFDDFCSYGERKEME